MVGAYVAWLAALALGWFVFGDVLVALIASLFVLVPAVRWASSR